jgi:hypothetical protein
MSARMNIKEVRDFIADATVEDNQIVGDLTFSDEDITGAMKSAARHYNSIPPLGTGNVTPDSLTTDTNIFFDGTAYYLFLKEYQRRTKADIDYTAGGVTTNLEAKRIAYLEKLMKLHKEQFETAAKTRKITINLNNAYAHYD